MTKSSTLIGRGQFINGSWIKGKEYDLVSTNPANGTVLWQGTQASAQDTDKAYTAARQALASWSNTHFEQRCNYLKQFTQQVEKNAQQLALLISMETGKPLWESRMEVQAVISKIDISIQAYQERTWPRQTNTADANACLRFKPQGVVVVLGAFNFPAHINNAHIIPALLAGNTVIYKPSELTPAVAELIMQCWQDSGLPPGVINCLQGTGEVASSLLTQDIQGVYFTGSYKTGLRIHQQFSARPEVILALEMGGNNPLVLDEVADINAAVYTTLLSSYITAGQRCTCARRLFIPNTPRGDDFLGRLIKASSTLRIGAYDAQPEEPFIGPVISHQHALLQLESQKKLLALGGTSLLSMQLSTGGGAFLSPGIIDMTDVASPPDDEIFAPFIQLYRYQTFEQALELANQTRYGLSAGLLSDSPEKYQLFYNVLRSGLINWNRPTTGASNNLPFGGVGCSGNHRPSAYFAADYCSYPVASMEQPLLVRPKQLMPGIVLESN
ncbi:MAG: succinylglutamate-semialdehyde dehydrogenase [Legionellales bacterium]